MSVSTSNLRRLDAFSVLGVARSATPGEIEAAWKRRVFETHPDRSRGSSDEFMLVNEAYAALRGERTTRASATDRPARPEPPAEPAEAPRPKRPQGLQPRRHRIMERNDAVSEDVLKLCSRKLLEAGAGTHHVPHLIRRRGRDLTYLIRSPLKRGANHIALPSGELVDHRRIKAVMLTFEAFEAGNHMLEVTEPTLGNLFPGAKSVSIEFGAEI